MGNLVLFLAVFVVFVLGSFFIIQSLIRQIKIRRAIQANKLLLNRMRDKNEDGNFHTYNNLLHQTLVNLKGRIKNLPYKKLQSVIDKEINNLTGGYVRRFVSSIWVLLKFTFALVFVFMSFMFALIVIDEFKVVENVQDVFDINSNNDVRDIESDDNPLTTQESKDDRDKQIYEEGLTAYNEGRTSEAVEALNKINGKSEYYEKSQEMLKDIDKKIYWENIKYPNYAEITKSPQNYIEKKVGFTGSILDVVEYNGKTMMIIGTDLINDYYKVYGGDILVLYGNVTGYEEGDFVSIAGTMKGSYIETEQKGLIGSYLNNASSFSPSGYVNINQMPVIIADIIDYQ
ncbi:hypothetical protein J2D69_19265 [Lysinibacillus sphaericus]|uniref:Uncharacterized protein n=3 Tax=Lysinibacillus TaxID=400634 RepID=W7S2R4_LYSSH|nr:MULTISPECIES: hypothetical protein [Lysinibacillus]MBE5084380.1 hypothetical protein [Bacillus thuringiensis]ACA38115.1 hypothetical protein Bsph_0490 [Lysinibacillus sphaericus C3-41]AMO32282.1 hypothetical protein AR327_07280 [Lysinibacillus sphaericus]AMR92619.1 hypothetical protein A1T07_21930 [Lysinibacillus sphaericus]ANA46668.1 hypothetical protein A2J09_14600 [Lysinibacillus sphaericus]